MSVIDQLKQTEARLRRLRAPKGAGNGHNFGQSRAAKTLARQRERRARAGEAETTANETETTPGDQ